MLGKESRSTWRRRGCCWCQLVPRTLRSPFPEMFPHRWPSAHTESLCAFHNRRIPSSFHFTCLCLLPLAPLPVLTCSYKLLQRRHKGCKCLFLRSKTGAQPCAELTRVALLWLLGHCLAAGIVSHATPVPSVLPGLPLLRSRAAEQNLKPPQSPSTKHGVCVASERLASPLPPAV